MQSANPSIMSTEECVDTNLEDGEIADSDVEDGMYVPLARPDNFNPPSLVNMQIQDEGSDSPNTEESSGSDSDGAISAPKIRRTKFKPQRPQQPPAKKKYDIWCATVQEQVLTEDMVGCDVKTRQYGVESYDYTIKYRLENNANNFDKSSPPRETTSGNKRTNADRKSVKLRLGKRRNNHQESMGGGEARKLPNLAVTENDPLEDVAKEIADSLKEEKKDLLLRIVEVVGPSRAIELYEEAKQVEEDGGILVMNGYRRRTPGGVYIFLLKRSPWASAEMLRLIFREEKAKNQREKKRANSTHRDHKVQQLKQTLNDSELPSLQLRCDSTPHSTEHGSNPPPSPATRDGSSDTDTQSHPETPAERPYQEQSRSAEVDYDDDFLEVNCSDDMDFF